MPETQEDDVAGHVRREHAAERWIANRIDKAGREGQRQPRPREWMPQASRAALSAASSRCEALSDPAMEFIAYLCLASEISG